MDLFELIGAMQARTKVMAPVQSAALQSVIIGTVAGVCYRLDQDGALRIQAELLENGKNSVVIVPAEAVRLNSPKSG